ncbi:MAG: DNA-3-methyladenine glycosylase family protein [Ruthenibacterium lactatiformans]
MQLSIPDLDLRHIYESGQCFRWEPLGQDTYRIPAFGARSLYGRQTAFSIFLRRREFDALWRSYFDLDTDYAAIKARVAPRDAYLQAAVAYGWGMRILRQDLWEVIVSFIVSQNNNIPRIRKNLRDLCAMQGGAFPTPVALAAAQPETLRALGLGYRAEYLCAAGAHFTQADALDALRAMSYPEAHTALRAVKGVGPKVADCICLFGLHHVDAFPVDTHVKQILSAHYPKGFPFRRYAGCAGILQQYMFYYDLHGSAQAARNTAAPRNLCSGALLV